VTLRVRLDVADGARLAELYREGEVLSREQDGERYEVVVRLDPSRAARLRQNGMEVVDTPAERMRLRKASG
jgi:GTP-binding protein HflX